MTLFAYEKKNTVNIEFVKRINHWLVTALHSLVIAGDFYVTENINNNVFSLRN